MTRIDRYVLRQFVMTMVYSLVIFTIIFVAVNMMDNLDDFLDKHASVGMIATYYLYFIPEIIKLMIPMAMLMSALFTTGRLSTYNELSALKSGGVSLYRFMAPLLIFALLVSLGSIYFNGWVVPFANKKKYEIGRIYFQKDIEYVSRNNIFIQDSRTRILSIGLFDEPRNMALQVSIQDFDSLNPTRLVDRYDADQMEWNPVLNTWKLINGVERTFQGEHETITKFPFLSIGKLNFSPEDIRKKQEKPEEMDYTDLKQFIDNQQRAGHEVSRWLVDFYGKIAFPFASVIVVLFGVPFSSVKRRSGLGIEFAIAIGICFLYIIFLQISQAFGYNGDLDPLLTAWLANILFLAAGIYTLLRVPK
ncbi:MAG TPA: LPS export ABC transporter permease LptG [Bacteroidota bacterium]|nr:LPS export ABC transporter permease LptG [Bacteroidota bacterium]